MVYEKDYWRSKTLWINLLAVVGGIITAISGELAAGGTLTVIGVVNMVLRIITKHNLN